MKLVNTSVKRPIGVIMVVLAIIALGVVSLRNLAVDLFPEIDLPVAVVATSYQDAAPEDVENLISRPIESSVSSVEGIDTVQSQSQSGSSMVMMMFQNGTDLDQALLDVREQVDQVKGMLPDQAGDPNILRFSPEAMPVVYLGLTGGDTAELTEIANEQIVPYFERQAGVASVSVEGGLEREIQVELDEARMSQYGITSQSVMQAISDSNNSSSVGTVEQGNQDLQLRVTGEFESINDIEETRIQTEAGDVIQVSDVATVNDDFKDRSSDTLVDGEPAIVLSVMKQTDANTVEVASNIESSMEDLKGDLPEGANLKTVIDTSDFIEMSIDSVINNILIGGAIAFLILLLFLKSFRATIVIGLSIPIALISTFTLMYFTGQTLNVLTLGGLALGIGMMVDSSIIILENIYSYKRRGYNLFDSATKGASELAPAVIASTTTTLVVFLPIIFVEGLSADLFAPLALAVSFSLIASLVVAITLVPMLSSKLLSKAMEDKGRRYWFDRFLDWLRELYSGGLSRVLKFRKTTVLVVILAIAGSLALIPRMGAEFMPSSDQGQAQITVETAPGSSLAYTQTISDQVNEVLSQYDDVIETSYVTVGATGFESGNQASYTIQMTPVAEREQTTTQIVQNLDDELQHIAGAEIVASAMDGGMQMGDPITIQLNGQEHEVLSDLSEEVLQEINQVDGVFNASSAASEGIPQMTITVDDAVARSYGLTSDQVSSQIRMKFSGQVVTQYREDGQEMDVTLVYPQEERNTINDLQDMSIQSPSGAKVPLDELVELEQEQGPESLLRENQQPQMNITSDVVDRDLGSVVSDVESALDNIHFPEGYSYSIGGQAADMEEAFAELAIALVFSIFLVYAVMAIQFENLLQPFIIMFALPTTVIGVIGGLWITGLSLSIPAFIGVIMLAGIVVNNSIVLVDYINILRRRGTDRIESIIEAGKSRLRPILMTTLTTILAMVPLGLGIGEGAELQQPLAVTIIFGLTVSSFFTLLFVPVIYLMFDNMTTKFRRKKKEA
ncbi:acriflavine resistance protein (cation efflux system) [Oceanobacillus iheyensis HTE831]|uniref:Acriflavine resistance protein (Cation efflux system) n=1 Tax=Oceanobacillus iheyensis (strain DSM 14371 / CIP 107618 / JCM 11309 / KCTC 3954 / HTE831) TaxID=221109 RepID=Q8CX78_OCEIH|nr:efflux RND transporter permease subunit [Oceanobacillus iheyensis]BAC14896.1 acriflavine resistance protein (cation efflux system) [Oceanobacillus iheyensis HTE831]